MEKRQIGGLSVSAIGLGCMSMSQAYGKPDRSESERVLNRALDCGYTFLDTASVYGQGHNETLIGEVLKDRRNEFVLASKCGLSAKPDGGRAVDGRPETIKSVCEQSLKRLQTDVIDLYYLHRKDPDVPIEDSMGALADLVAQGKIRHIGLSEISATTLEKAHRVHPVAAVQSEYSLWTRDPEHNGVLKACRELQVGFVPFSPLGRAFLCGTIQDMAQLEGDDMRQGMPRFQGEHFNANLKLIEPFKQIAKEQGCSMAQLALAWVLAQEDGTLVPIPGTKHVKYLEENAAAAEVVLPPDVIEACNELINEKTVSGHRYNDKQMASIDTEPDN
ncbi:MAG: aldo/keto reductase [Gammaproteobacteria bacterium]|nr:aldo/keto reductase [Gammaproteobacteria bacterium]